MSSTALKSTESLNKITLMQEFVDALCVRFFPVYSRPIVMLIWILIDLIDVDTVILK